MKKVCIVTGTRAEYGLLKPLIQKISRDGNLELQLVVTGMHLSPEFGLTYKEIEKDGYIINEKVEGLLSSDTPIGITKSMGLTIISFAECYDRLKPDLLVVLGDRYEIFSAVSAALVARIAVAHIHGGEITEGLIDESFRHSITKMSYIHFTSNEEYRKRVIQLGEDPNRVYNVGAIGIENIKDMELLTREDLQNSINFKLGVRTALVTFHPVTLENSTSKEKFGNLLEALDQFDNLKVIFTKANSDTDGRVINTMIDEYVAKNKNNCIAFTSMGQLKYLSAMKYSDVVIGNSSSGIIEAPSFYIPTINIGDRQKGRLQAESIVNCKPITRDICEAMKMVLSESFNKKIAEIKNPYGEGNVSNKIIDIIKKHLMLDSINIKKTFYDLEVSSDR